ncbi:MAG: SIS domain-containing protein [Phycisphaeraceae bacterium]|nr:SIS domain-containing protein [Phycisphaeraceae bacterium]
MNGTNRHGVEAGAVDLEPARRLLRAESATLAALADGLGEAFARSVGLVAACAGGGGNVLVSGLGKSGLIGQKIAATLSSLAITSHFVHPAEAAHGDLGRFRPSDLCVALSYSGETDEVVNLAAILRQDGIPIVAITRGSRYATNGTAAATGGSGVSSLERLASETLAIGECDDPALTPAPMCSTTAMLAIGDALALCAARLRNFTDDEFARRHPGGSLGGLLRPVMDILRFRAGENLVTVPDDLPVAEALASADCDHARRPGALLLTDRASGRLAGIFTDGDLRRLVLRGVEDLRRPIREIMTRDPATLPHTAVVRDAVRMVRENRRDEIPIVDDRHVPVGILDVQDLIAMRLVRDDRA